MKTAAINMQKVEVDHFYIQRFNMSVHTENSLDNFSCVYYYKYVVRYRTINNQATQPSSVINKTIWACIEQH